MHFTNRNFSVLPGNDFYEHAVGGWIRGAVIPKEFAAWGAFEELFEYNLSLLKGLVTEQHGLAGEDLQRFEFLSQLYRSGMDEAAIEKGGLSSLENILAEIAAVQTPTALARVVAGLHRSGPRPLFAFVATPDQKNSQMMIGAIYQAGLSLPDRDYYLLDDERNKAVRERFQSYVVEMLSLAGLETAMASTIMAVETALAKVSYSREVLRDPQKNYHKISRLALQELVPAFDWQNYFEAIGFTQTELDVGQLDFFKDLNLVLKQFTWSDWQAYVRWHVLDNFAFALPQAFVDARFRFYGTFLNGQEELRPRWKRVLSTVEECCLGDALGKLYVARHFSEAAKTRALELVSYLIESTRERLRSLPWMSAVTKEEAFKKLDRLKVKIGYPEIWVDYSKLILPEGYLAQVLAAREFEFARYRDKIGKPVDTREWQMDPQVINAYYSPDRNEIVFPAGILQPPFFSPDFDDAVNFGAIGGIIGHEITHGFDDQGRQYDAEGNLRDWWTKADEAQFLERSKALAKQYGVYEVVPEAKVNGEFTLGENIADLGGVTIAFAGLKRKLAGQAQPLDGLTPEQRFFLAWAEGWKQKTREERARLLVVVDPHAPPKFRVNGPLTNFPPFREAFNVQPGEALYKADEDCVIIW